MRVSQRKLFKQADELFSKIVRSQGYCTRCLRDTNLQCAHIVSRKNKHLRWDLNNAVCLDVGCHLFWAHKEPLEFSEWVRTNFPKEYEYLMREKEVKEYTMDMESVISSLKLRLIELGI